MLEMLFVGTVHLARIEHHSRRTLQENFLNWRIKLN